MGPTGIICCIIEVMIVIVMCYCDDGTGGAQNRTVFCRHSGTGVCLAESNCAGAKPAVQQSCTVSATGATLLL